MGLVLALTVIALPVASAYAAPVAVTSTPITGTIQSITTSTNTAGDTIVVVTLTDGSGNTQTVDLTVANAVSLGLVTQNPDGSVTVNSTMVGQSITIDSSMVYTDPCILPTGANQPVNTALTDFFCKTIGIDYNTIQTYHQDGYGYGVIAQACFMAQILGGDASLCTAILDAKKSGDYSAITLPDGTTVTNWGQLRKDVLGHGMQDLTNPGAIMSGRAGGTGNGNGHTNGQGGGQGKGSSNGHGKP